MGLQGASVTATLELRREKDATSKRGLEGTRLFGSFINVFYDDVRLRSAPPPALPALGSASRAWLLCALTAAGALLATARRRSA